MILLKRGLKRGNSKYEFILERVETAEDMKSALEKKKWDLIISDYNLVMFTGIDAFKITKELGLDIPFIIVSGAIGEETAINAMKLGVHDYIMKDNLSRLIPAIERELEEAKIRLERKQMKIALSEEKELLSVTLRSITDGVISTNKSGQIILMNKIAEKITEFDQNEILNKKFYDTINILNVDTLKPIKDPIKTVIKKENIFNFPKSSVLISKSGKERIIEGSIAPIYDNKSAIIGTVIVFRDVTLQRMIEAEIITNQKIESIGLLAGGIAHDFNNLLTSIIGNISLLMMDADKDSESYSALLDAESGALRAKDLTKQLLTFSKGGSPIKKTSSIKKFIRESANFAIHGSSVDLKYKISPNLWPVNVDIGQIGQVIQNLVINSVHAVETDGKIIICAENISLKKKNDFTLPKGKYIKISVEDNGIGIPHTILPKIFDPYFSTKTEGNGLGLSVCHSIIRNHQGKIFVESEVNSGTIITFYLPAQPDVKIIKKTKAKSPKKGKGIILILEDEVVIQRVIKSMLQRLNYKPIITSKGIETISAYKEYKNQGKKIDAVILDLTVKGGMGGQQTIKKLIETDPNVKGIASSGYATGEVMSNFKRYGFSGVLVKPYTISNLANILESIINNNEKKPLKKVINA